MTRWTLARCALLVCAGWTAASGASAATFQFDTDPFAGSTARSTPGRQIVGGETFIDFNVATDLFAFQKSAFELVGDVSFANGQVASLPASGLNIAVVADLDNDGNPGTPFGAGSAATLLANHITSVGPGFFIYFNSGLGLPRLVYSTDLSDPTADLKILARLQNLAGNPASLGDFTARHFAFFDPVPEPANWALLIAGFGLLGTAVRRRAADRAALA